MHVYMYVCMFLRMFVNACVYVCMKKHIISRRTHSNDEYAHANSHIYMVMIIFMPA